MTLRKAYITLVGSLVAALLLTALGGRWAGLLAPRSAQAAASAVAATVNKHGDYEIKLQVHAGDTIEVTMDAKVQYKTLYTQARYDAYLAKKSYDGGAIKQKSDTEFSFTATTDGAAYVIMVPFKGQKLSATGKVVTLAKPVVFYDTIDYGKLATLTAEEYIHVILHQSNAARKAAGCPPLVLDSRLALAAQSHSKDMGTRNFFSHDAPDGTGLGVRVGKSGFVGAGAAGENITAGHTKPENAFEAWMNSPGHRGNILRCSFRSIGIGVFQSPKPSTYTYYWTQVFSEGVSPAAAQGAPAQAAPTTAATQAAPTKVPGQAAPTAAPTQAAATAAPAQPAAANLGNVYTHGSAQGSLNLVFDGFDDEVYTLVVTPDGGGNPAISVKGGSKVIGQSDKAGAGAPEQLEFTVPSKGEYTASIQLGKTDKASFTLYYRPKTAAPAAPEPPAPPSTPPVQEAPSAFAVGQQVAVSDGHDWYQGEVVAKDGDYVDVAFVNKYGHATSAHAHIGDPGQVLTLKDAQAMKIKITAPNSSTAADPTQAPQHTAQPDKASDFKQGQDVAVHFNGMWIKAKLTAIEVEGGQIKLATVEFKHGHELTELLIEAPTADVLLTLKQAEQAGITVVTLPTSDPPAAPAAPADSGMPAPGAPVRASDFKVGQEVAIHSGGEWYKTTIMELTPDKDTLKRIVAEATVTENGMHYTVRDEISGSITTNDLLTLQQAEARKITLSHP